MIQKNTKCLPAKLSKLSNSGLSLKKNIDKRGQNRDIWGVSLWKKENLLEKFRSPLIFDFYRVSKQKKETNKAKNTLASFL